MAESSFATVVGALLAAHVLGWVLARAVARVGMPPARPTVDDYLRRIRPRRGGQ